MATYIDAAERFCWAQKRLAELNRAIIEIEQGKATDFWSLTEVANEECEGKVDAVFRQVNSLPTEIAQLLSEVITHLRITLDYLVYQMVERKKGEKPGRQVKFPFSGKGECRYAKTVIDVTEGIFSIHDDFFSILKAFQPWPVEGSGERGAPKTETTLWTLNELANVDKHRALVVATSNPIVPSMAADFTNQSYFTLSERSVAVDGQMHSGKLDPGEAEKMMSNWMGFKVVFGKPSSGGEAHDYIGEEILPVINWLSDRVGEVIGFAEDLS